MMGMDVWLSEMWARLNLSEFENSTSRFQRKGLSRFHISFNCTPWLVEPLFGFSRHGNWELEEIVKLLNEELPLVVSITDAGTLSFQYTKPFQLTDASHRVKLILGLYHMKFPINSDSDNFIYADSTPMLNYGNVLYLRSLQGNSVGMIHDSVNVYAPCIYRINTFLKSGLPLISDKKGDKIIVNAEAAKTITMQLVDFMYEPVILKSPMFITLKIKMHELLNNTHF